MERERDRDLVDDVNGLTPRDLYVLRKIADGAPIKALLPELGLTLCGVRAVVTRIKIKLGATTIAHAVAKYLRDEYARAPVDPAIDVVYKPFSRAGDRPYREGSRRLHRYGRRPGASSHPVEREAIE